MTPSLPVPASPSRVALPDFPGTVLRLPPDTGAVIDGLTMVTLDTANLPSFEYLAAQTIFGPDAGRLMQAGLDARGAASVARWGSALFHLATALHDARNTTGWHAKKHIRDLARQKAVDAVDDVLMRKCVGQWGGTDAAQAIKDHRLTRADIEPAKGGAEARMAVYQFQGRVDRLMRPLPIGLAALLDPTGWAETRLMLIGEGAMLKSELDGRQRFSADWVLRTYGPGLPPPE